MQHRHLTSLPCLAFFLVASQGWAQYAQTYVEPAGKECGTTKLIAPGAFGQPTLLATGPDLDGDGVAGANEDTDSDAIYATLATAISNTTAGGVVNILGPGLFKANLTLSSGITIRGPAGGGAIIEPPCTSPGNDGISVTGATIVRLENLTIRGFVNGSAVTLDGTSGQLVVLQNCNLELSGTGLTNAAGNSNGAVELHECHVISNVGSGIYQNGASSRLSVFGSVVARNGGNGIVLGTETSWGLVRISRSRIVGNADVGIKSVVSGTSVSGSLSAHDTDISGNVNEGIKFSATSGNGAAVLALTDCSIVGNGGDGVQLTNGGASRLALVDTRILQNGADGIQVSAALTVDLTRNVITQNVGYGINDTSGATINCKPGFNVIVANPSGVALTTTNCTNGTPVQNNQN